jgi:hypothetical protein
MVWLSPCLSYQAWLDCLYPPLLHTLRRLDPHSVEAWVTPRYVKISLWAAVREINGLQGLT